MINQFKQIQSRFNKASKSYDDVAWVQKEAADFLVDKLFKHKNFIPKTFLDLATGTGYIPELLLEKFPQSSFYLNDIAGEMLEVCKDKFSKFNNIYYLLGDMLELDANCYDCIISNFALQWIPDLQYAIHFIHSRSSHIFAFSTLLDGTFKEWENIMNKHQPIQMMKYPQPEELIILCNKLKSHDQIFEFWLMDVPLLFDNPKAFMGYIKLLGASASDKPLHVSSLKKLLKDEDQSFIATYKIFFGIFRKVNE